MLQFSAIYHSHLCCLHHGTCMLGERRRKLIQGITSSTVTPTDGAPDPFLWLWYRVCFSFSSPHYKHGDFIGSIKQFAIAIFSLSGRRTSTAFANAKAVGIKVAVLISSDHPHCMSEDETKRAKGALWDTELRSWGQELFWLFCVLDGSVLYSPVILSAFWDTASMTSTLNITFCMRLLSLVLWIVICWYHEVFSMS